MGDSGDAGEDSDGSASDADAGAFEFGDIADGADDIADAVDFSGPDFLDEEEDDSDDDDTDPPDEPDPDSDDDAAGEPEVVSVAGDTQEPEVVATTDDGPAQAGGTAASADGPGQQEERGSTASSGDGSESSDPEEDEPDPPDEPDGDGSSEGSFYDIDPVDKSQKAFNFAEDQSKAAYEYAYEGATKNPLARFLRKYTSREARERIDEVFSRRMLGSVLVGGAFSKIIETCVEVYFGASSVWRPVMWAIIFVVATVVFVWWDRLAQKASEAAKSASEAASEAAESASQKAEEASEAASKAAEAASAADDGGDEERTRETTTDSGVDPTGTGQTADTRSNGVAGIKRARRGSGPNRRPNRRFFSDSRVADRPDYFSEGSEFEQIELDDIPGEGGGFKNAGDGVEQSPAGSQAWSDDAEGR